MFKNFLKITFRSLWKNKTFVFINVVGMGISLACCIVAYLNYNFNDSFDKHEVNLNKTYRIDFIREFQGDSRTWGIAPLAMGMAVRENVTDIEHLVRYVPGGGSVKIKDDLFNTRIRYVDDTFFKVFSYEAVSGTLNGLDDKSNIFINEETAKKFFGINTTTQAGFPRSSIRLTSYSSTTLAIWLVTV